MPHGQAVPLKYAIDMDNCIQCYKCVSACGRLDAIDFAQEPQIVDLEVGTIIVATGFESFDPAVIPEYGYGRYPNVITAMELERLANSAGPTVGRLIRPSDGKAPKSIAMVQCVGSRDARYHEYCSGFCCMYTIKNALLLKQANPDMDVTIYYMDIRTPAKGYEEFYKRLMREDVTFIRGKAAEVTNWPMSPEEEGKLVVKAEDTLLGQIRRVPVDMVILSPALQAREGAQTLAQTLGIGCGGEGFFLERHPKLAPVQTAADGVYVAGACQSPKDIPDSVAQGAAAAANILSLIDKGMFSIEPVVAVIDETLCGGCRTCINMCPYSALSADEERNVAVCESALCKGCGTCVATCPAGAIQQQGYTDAQIRAELEGALGRLAASSAE